MPNCAQLQTCPKLLKNYWGCPKLWVLKTGVPNSGLVLAWGARLACLAGDCPTKGAQNLRCPKLGCPNLGVPKTPNCGCQKLGCLTAQSWVPKTGVPKSGGAPQQQTQTKNCRTHLRQRLRNKHKRRIANLPKSLLSQRPSRNKHKRRIATPTSPKACRKGAVETNTNEEWQFFVRVCFWGFLCVSRLWGGWCGNSSYFSRVISCVVTVV